MGLILRAYQSPGDYQRVSDFLTQHYLPGNADGNWIAPAWEYMHYHPALNSDVLDRIGIWEEDGKIVAVAHYEWRLGEAFFEVDPAYRAMRYEMLQYAEEALAGETPEGGKTLRVYVNDNDPDFQALVRSRGYQIDLNETRPMYRFDIPDPFPPIAVAEGFRLKSLADECDWAKVHRVMWRGFNHPGEPPAGEEELESRRKMFDTPSARRDLKIVTQAPDGNFASFCGMFYEPVRRFAYVEPVATDQAYRRLGLGKAAVLEGIRRCGQLGVTVAYVGSDQAFYQAIGFKKVYDSQCWEKTW